MAIAISMERCDGCGACVETCPTGALYLVEGKAAVDRALCRECEVCVAACLRGAILLTAQEEPMAEGTRLPALRPEPAVISVKSQPALLAFRSRVLPVVTAALAWAGRELLPSLAEFLLETLDRRTTQPQTRSGRRSSETPTPAVEGTDRQHRHRWRGGSE